MSYWKEPSFHDHLPFSAVPFILHASESYFRNAPLLKRGSIDKRITGLIYNVNEFLKASRKGLSSSFYTGTEWWSFVKSVEGWNCSVSVRPHRSGEKVPRKAGHLDFLVSITRGTEARSLLPSLFGATELWFTVPIKRILESVSMGVTLSHFHYI